MASASSDQRPVLGRVDAHGRLVSADPDLAALQMEAGSRMGAELALPQVAGIAELARKLGVPVSRPAVAAGSEQDIDMWVKATPEGDEVILSLERWSFRPAAPPRLGALVSHEQEVEFGGAPDQWATDEEMRVVNLSPGLAERLGVSPAEAIGKPFTRLFRLEEDESGELPLLSAAASRSDFSGQRARARAGGSGLLILRGKAVTGADGSFAGFQGEALLEQPAGGSGLELAASPLDQALDEALRSPLDRIIEGADRIVQQAEGPLRSDYADYASDIAAAARHLLSVIRSMSGESAADHDRVDLAALAVEAAGMLEASADARRVLLALEPSDPLMARGEARGVIQILVNLIGNAVRHSPDGGTVSISFESREGTVQVDVADEGAGIDPADQQRIFERFEQAKGGEGGTGLGLAIARRLARSMGGDILLESIPGEGARFSLILPAA